MKHDTELALEILNLENGMVVWHDCLQVKDINKYLSECKLYVFNVEHTQVAFMHSRKG